MNLKRVERTNKLLKEEINNILLKEFDFVNVLVTIIDVRSSDDLKSCDVEVSILPESKEQVILDFLFRHTYDIQKTINRKLKMRPVPRIRFRIDKDIKKLHKIDELIGKTK
jgi:ribosome-binding factor A